MRCIQLCKTKVLFNNHKPLDRLLESLKGMLKISKMSLGKTFSNKIHIQNLDLSYRLAKILQFFREQAAISRMTY